MSESIERTRSLDRKELLSGTVVAIVGAVLLFEAHRMESPTTSGDSLGPAVFPTVASVVLLVGGLIMTVSALRNRTQSTTPVRLDGDGMEEEMRLVGEVMAEDAVPPKRLLAVLAAFLVYIIAFVPMGFIVSTAVFLSGIATFAQRDKWPRNVVAGIGTSVVTYLFFTQVLDVQLPPGVLG